MKHRQLIGICQALGYTQQTSEGICHGFSAMWAQAVCSNDLATFNKRLNYLERFKDKPEHLKDLIEQAQRNVAKGKFNDNDEFLIEIQAFFQNVALHLAPSTGINIFNKAYQHNEVKIAPYTQSASLEKMGGLSRTFFRVDQYNETTLKNYLVNLSEQLKDKNNAAILLSANRHTVSVRVLGKNQFELLDTNYLDERGKRYTAEELAAKLDYQSFNNNNRLISWLTGTKNPLVMKTAVFTAEDNQFELDIPATEVEVKILHPSSGSLLLHTAAFSNDVATLKHINFNCIDVNLPNSEDMSPLAIACGTGSKEAVEYLLTIPDININLETKTGRTPLSFAIESGNEAIVALLLNRGAKVNKIDSLGYTLLHQALLSGNPRLIEEMLDDPDISINQKTNRNLRTPLHLACYIGNRDIVQKLISRPNIDFNALCSEGLTPLMVACRMNHSELIPLLIDKTDLSIKDIAPDSPLIKLIPTCHPEIQLKFLQKAISCYIAHRQKEAVYTNQWQRGFSREEKLTAAEALRDIVDGKKVDITSHEKVLSNGRLAALYNLYTNNLQGLELDKKPKQTYVSVGESLGVTKQQNKTSKLSDNTSTRRHPAVTSTSSADDPNILLLTECDSKSAPDSEKSLSLISSPETISPTVSRTPTPFSFKPELVK
ncbi:ankyrin repeat domain-containing protein [Legionella sp. CNM-1927-20]|uniref:ankyrin repeat domain-containing protein n=1 Tax=Legionella sp. CNM-1927-20 TaxID=3422221 RepID=UPI00403B33EF